VVLGVPSPIETTRGLASDRVLSMMPEPKTHASPVTMADCKAVLDTPRASDDLQSLVRTVWALEHPSQFEVVSRMVSPAAIRQFWESNLTAGSYAAMVKAADICNYHKLRELIRTLVRD